MKKSIPKVRERESEASILGNDREREFPLTPAHAQKSQILQEVAHYTMLIKISSTEKAGSRIDQTFC